MDREVERVVHITKEVPVDRIVKQTVEVIREVPVDRVVEKPVIKEVPVERIVERRIPVETVRRELVYVPFFTDDTDLLLSQNVAVDAGSAAVEGIGKKIVERVSQRRKKEHGNENQSVDAPGTAAAGD